MQNILSYDAYTLVFEDHFDGPGLNRGNWDVELHEPGWVNEELQEYVDAPENICVRDSNLVIRPVKILLADGSAAYTSGRITTRNKHDFTYGIFEARIKVPKGKGFLPAFWLMTGDEATYGQWPRCGEIDIMEVQGHDTGMNHGTIHFGMPHCQNQGVLRLAQGDFSEDYHRFALEWLPGKLRWFVDGVAFFETSNWFSAGEDGTEAPFPAPFDHEMYIILNLAVGGSWVGYPDDTADFEQAALLVDYVRVYQKEAHL